MRSSVILSAVVVSLLLLNIGPARSVGKGPYLGSTGLFPGTLWCGAGNNASSRQALGIFPGTDRCCRAHDLCPLKIPPVSARFDLLNSRPHTVLHCACDDSFRSCLRLDGSHKSQLVGRFYFNQLKVPCFVLTKGKRRPGAKRCVERSWWGGCQKEVDDENPIYGEWRKAVSFKGSKTFL